MAPENVSPLVVWLGSTESRDVTGKVFEVEGGKIRVAEGWAHGPQIDKGAKMGSRRAGAGGRRSAGQVAPAGPRLRGLGLLYAAQSASGTPWTQIQRVRGRR